LKTLPINLKRDPSLPSGLHDPKWKDPAVASRVALGWHTRLMVTQAALFQATGLLPSGKALEGRTGNVDKRSFPLTTRHPTSGGGMFVGGSYGEIYHRYSFGGRLPTVNFHAKAVVFGADSDGRFFLGSTVVRMDGGWGNSASLVLRFLAGTNEVGGIFWEDTLDPPQDKDVLVVGHSDALKAAFPQLTEAAVTFHTVHKPA